MMKKGFAVLVLALLAGCATSFPSDTRTTISQVPMYGGIDRNTIPELKAADEKLIKDTTEHYGSREKACAAFLNNGFAYYQKDDLANAMRRFNQAWLLDPKNSEVYWGFSSVLHDQGKNCEAMHMIDKALTLNPPKTKGFYPDAGRIITLCAVSDKMISAEEKAKLIDRSESLYREAEQTDLGKAYLYDSWATANYWRGQYQEAWAMVTKSRSAGGQPTERFLSLLRAKLPEPATK